MIAPAFYVTKNVCDYENPLYCYMYFCVGFVCIITTNYLLNFFALEKNSIKIFLFLKTLFYITPILIFVYLRT